MSNKQSKKLKYKSNIYIFLKDLTSNNHNNLNRSIKTQRTIKPKIPIQFYRIGLTIMIGPLGLVQLTNRKTGKKTCKQSN